MDTDDFFYQVFQLFIEFSKIIRIMETRWNKWLFRTSILCGKGKKIKTWNQWSFFELEFKAKNSLLNTYLYKRSTSILRRRQTQRPDPQWWDSRSIDRPCPRLEEGKPLRGCLGRHSSWSLQRTSTQRVSSKNTFSTLNKLNLRSKIKQGKFERIFERLE